VIVLFALVRNRPVSSAPTIATLLPLDINYNYSRFMIIKTGRAQ